jgi:hypothetical protein
MVLRFVAAHVQDERFNFYNSLMIAGVLRERRLIYLAIAPLLAL